METPQFKEQMTVCRRHRKDELEEAGKTNIKCVVMPQRIRSKEKQWDFGRRVLW